MNLIAKFCFRNDPPLPCNYNCACGRLRTAHNANTNTTPPLTILLVNRQRPPLPLLPPVLWQLHGLGLPRFPPQYA